MSAEFVDGIVSTIVRVLEAFGVDFKSAFDGDGAGGELGGFSFFHFDDDAIVEHGTWSEAAFFVVADQDEAFDSGALHDGIGEDVAADSHRLLVQFFEGLGEHRIFEFAAAFDLELQIIEGEFAAFPGGFTGFSFFEFVECGFLGRDFFGGFVVGFCFVVSFDFVVTFDFVVWLGSVFFVGGCFVFVFVFGGGSFLRGVIFGRGSVGIVGDWLGGEQCQGAREEDQKYGKVGDLEERLEMQVVHLMNSEEARGA